MTNHSPDTDPDSSSACFRPQAFDHPAFALGNSSFDQKARRFSSFRAAVLPPFLTYFTSSLMYHHLSFSGFVRRLLHRSMVPGILALLLSPLCGRAQTQTFGVVTPTAGELQFSPDANAGYFTRTGGTGTGAFGVSGSAAASKTAVIDFVERTIPAGAAGSTLAFEMANPVGTFNAASRLRVFVSLNGAAFNPEIDIFSNTISFNYNFAASNGNPSNITKTYTGTSTAFNMSSPPRKAFDNVILTLPTAPATQGLRIKIRLELTAAAVATLLIDNVALLRRDNTTPLPVELTRFEATAQAGYVRLNWATASEKNSDRFEVQRSASGEEFLPIGSVQSQGSSSSPHEYAFVDSRPLAGRAYYRLRQLDTDGSSAYSPVVAVLGRPEDTVYPNPSTDFVILPASTGPVRYRVLNALGQSVRSGTATGHDRLDVAALPKGLFFLELRDAAGRSTQRLLHE